MVVRLTILVAVFALAGSVRGDLHVEVRPFGPGEVELSEGAYETTFARAEKRVRAVDPAPLLAPFRSAAGLPAKAKPLTCSAERDPATVGQALGHYLSALSALFAVTQDEDVKDRIWYVVEELYGCSLKNRSLLPIPDAQAFDGTTFRFPAHTAFAVLAGLHDAFRATENQRAFHLVVQWVDWYQRIWQKEMENPARDKWLAGDWGGLNRVYLYVYNEFGRENYLHDGWNAFNQRPYFDEMRKGNFDFASETPKALSAKMCGVYMRHRRSGWGELHKASAAYLDYAMKTRDYGVNAPDALVNLVWLAARLNEENPNGRLGDFVAARTALLFKDGSTSAPVGIVDVFTLKARENIYATSPKTLWVNQYVPSRVNWSAKGVALSTTATENEPKGFDLKITAKAPVAFKLMLRQQKGKMPQVTLDGARLAVAADTSGYAAIERTWTHGDVLHVSF